MKILFYIIISLFIFNCSNLKEEEEAATTLKSTTINETGKQELENILNQLEKDSLQLNHTTKQDLALLYNIDVNDYYMSKKLELTDHTLYITFTILNNVLIKISYAALSNANKDFGYISKTIEDKLGNEFVLLFNTSDSSLNNSTKIWKDSNEVIKLNSFQGLNSGYELIIE